MPDVKPIVFACRRETTASLAEIVDHILSPENWTTFKGWGPLPGIRSAALERRTPELVGTKFRVVSTNGDRHASSGRRSLPPDKRRAFHRVPPLGRHRSTERDPCLQT